MKTKIVTGTRIDRYDDLYTMDVPHTDESGKVWPAGTQYRPSFGGVDNTRTAYQCVSVRGRQVRFEAQS